MTQITGKNILLTGASRGLGPVIARALAEKGAYLALAARSDEGLRATKQSLRENAERAMVFPADLEQESGRIALVERVLSEFGAIDILVNNAGIESEGAFLDLSWEAVRQNLELNLAAPIHLTHLVLPGMLERTSGHVVNIASIAARCGSPMAAIYSGSKAGLAEWARALRLELAGTGVHFSTICPGFVTEVGMFARFGVTPPGIIGSCTPLQVAKAVVRAIARNQVDVIVNWPPQRLNFALMELFPSLGDWVILNLGIAAFQYKKLGKDVGGR